MTEKPSIHQDLFKHVLMSRRTDQLARWMTVDHALTSDLALPIVDRPEAWVGPTGFSRFAALVLKQLSRTQFTVIRQYVADQRLTSEITVLGEHTGRLGSIQPTHLCPTIRALVSSELKDGKLSATWIVTDALAVLARHNAWRVPDASRGGKSEVFDEDA